MELVLWILGIWMAAVVFVLLLNSRLSKRINEADREDHW